MPWDKGFNFRNTSGYVSDGANETYVLGTDTYAVTRNSVTFGWVSTPGYAQTRDRDSGVDRRFAGIVFAQDPASGQTAYLRIDLPSSGSYKIHLALGDTAYSQSPQYLEIQDDFTPVLTINDSDGTAVDHYDDATGTDRTEANWASVEATATVTFSTATMRVWIGRQSPATYSSLAHLRIEQVSAETPTIIGYAMVG